MPAPEYRITSLKDVFEQVPIDRVHACMRELATLIRMAKEMPALLGDAATFHFPDEIIWRDDGERKIDWTLYFVDKTTTTKENASGS